MTTMPLIPALAVNMRPVTKAAFYARMNCDVHPHLPGAWNAVTGYVSEWRTPDRTLLGISDGGTHLCKSRYWLAQ